jgi:hypothetical protein
MDVKFINKATLAAEAIQRRIKLVESSSHPEKSALLSELSGGSIPKRKFPDGFDIRNHVKPASQDLAQQGVLAEFIGTGNFGAEWNERRRYEVYAGRDQEPELWRAIYVETQDSTLPQVIPVYRIGPGGVVFTEVTQGGEVKFAEVLSSEFTVRLVDYAVGIKYSKELVKYNRLWSAGIVERQAGIAHNALQNDIHFSPIMDASYSAAGSKPTQTAAVTGGNLLQNYMSTIEKAVQDAKKRKIRGPYVIVTGSLNSLNVRKSLLITIQDGNPAQSPVNPEIQTVIEYDGWEGEMLGETYTYDGVADNVGYLIGLSDRVNDFQSYQNQGLESMMGNPDVSRRIMAQTVWDLDRGVFCDTTAVQKIQWPTP